MDNKFGDSSSLLINLLIYKECGIKVLLQPRSFQPAPSNGHLSGQTAQASETQRQEKAVPKNMNRHSPLPTQTLAPPHIHSPCAGGSKYPALRLDVGNFSWAPSAGHTGQGSRMLSVAHPAMGWSLPRPWGRSALCSWTARRRDSSVSPALRCLSGPRRGPGCLPRRKRFSTREWPSIPPSIRETPAGQASCLHRSKTRPAWPSRGPCIKGEGAGVLSEEDQGPKGQETLFLLS